MLRVGTAGSGRRNKGKGGGGQEEEERRRATTARTTTTATSTLFFLFFSTLVFFLFFSFLFFLFHHDSRISKEKGDVLLPLVQFALGKRWKHRKVASLLLFARRRRRPARHFLILIARAKKLSSLHCAFVVVFLVHLICNSASYL